MGISKTNDSETRSTDGRGCSLTSEFGVSKTRLIRTVSKHSASVEFWDRGIA